MIPALSGMFALVGLCMLTGDETRWPGVALIGLALIAAALSERRR